MLDFFKHSWDRHAGAMFPGLWLGADKQCDCFHINIPVNHLLSTIQLAIS